MAVDAEGGDKAGDRQHSGFDKKLGDLADAADVFGAVLGGKAEVLIEAVADVVSIEYEGQAAIGDEARWRPMASVDLPQPERPVSQMTAGL